LGPFRPPKIGDFRSGNRPDLKTRQSHFRTYLPLKGCLQVPRISLDGGTLGAAVSVLTRGSWQAVWRDLPSRHHVPATWVRGAHASSKLHRQASPGNLSMPWGSKSAEIPGRRAENFKPTCAQVPRISLDGGAVGSRGVGADPRGSWQAVWRGPANRHGVPAAWVRGAHSSSKVHRQASPGNLGMPRAIEVARDSRAPGRKCQANLPSSLSGR